MGCTCYFLSINILALWREVYWVLFVFFPFLFCFVAEMEMEQELEWLEAQKIAISVDLLAAAKQQLQFLAAVDKNRWLYEGPTLECAIYRYASRIELLKLLLRFIFMSLIFYDIQFLANLMQNNMVIYFGFLVKFHSQFLSFMLSLVSFCLFKWKITMNFLLKILYFFFWM